MSERLEAIREVCRNIGSRIDRDYIDECIRAKECPTKLVNDLAVSGLLALGVPEEQGGDGSGIVEVSTMLDELARHGLVAPRVITSQMARTSITRHGTKEQQAEFLKGSAEGEKFFSFAVTEAEAGTNTFRIRTAAKRDGESYVINGEKAYITGVHEADWMLLVARTSPYDPESKTSGISVFVVDPKSPGISIVPMDIAPIMPDKSSMVYLDNVRVDAQNMIGREGQGLQALFDCLNPERILAGAMNVGLSDFVLAKSSAYANDRAPFGRPIGSYQAVAHPLALAKARTDAARLMTYEAAELYDSGQNVELQSEMVKYLGAEAIKVSAEAAMSTFGGSSVDFETGLVPLYLHARFQEIAPLNSNVVLSSIGTLGLGLPRSY
ncbi:acyl-CoA dehydrogenase family protein [Rhodococcus erythropolis]|uniref:acyl-CoA dehydrogenase family protein n=1 Tax=Rhodococcus erythropolis TaxID=1833 RepID=UPI0024B7F59A|nr:acyl-CoA dehydrogenase family protein [Rhodococcus erythropolis]MDJ0015485.1 acyl-CoA dehydrogenase family protein [Rhodococcus erythropolis]